MYEYMAKLDRVVDGDTIDCKIDLGFNIWIHERVRLYGINAPESRTKDEEEKARGLSAKEYLIGMLDQSDNTFKIQTKLDKKGKYGRILGTIYIQDPDRIVNSNDYTLNLNKDMVQQGHAVEYYGGKR